MTYSGFEKKLDKVIYNMLSHHRQLNMYKMTTDFGHIPKYDILDMFLRYKDKNAL